MVSSYFWWQDVLSRVVAIVLLVPVMLAVGILGLLVRLTSRGPAIYRQRRVGLNGKQFTMYKVRTMRHDAELKTGAVWSVPGDPRVTPFGGFLRAFHLDELPQILNVLKGEMSLVGPRPERPDFTTELGSRIPRYLERLRAKPGITGLAQVNLPPDTDLESVSQKLAVDLEYIESASLSLDIRILLCTFLRLFGLRGRWFTRLLGIRRRGLPLPAPILNPAIPIAERTNSSPKQRVAK
jgi:lipopolysaccharide/colanic/teichoic acid biosynthesis glycosyltransferase